MTASVDEQASWVGRAQGDTVRIADVRKVAKEIASSGSALDFATRWGQADAFNLRSAALWGLAYSIDTLPGLPTIETMVVEFADDEDWRVREEASYLMKAALRRWVAEREAWFTSLARHSSERVRRCVAVGAGRASDSGTPELAMPLLSLIDILVHDAAPYVKKNTGAFAVGSYLLSAYPETTFSHITRWARCADPVVRWNAAASLSASGAARQPERSRAILGDLECDCDARVRRKARSARERLER